ncbi:MAG: hypothetical protein DIU76_00900 [Bacillota bacterium]|nr:MAG: hypothetical protein DIU76_00900 [Bacillota bacterium]
MVSSGGVRRDDGMAYPLPRVQPEGSADRGRPSERLVPWEPGDRWLVPAEPGVDRAQGAADLPDPSSRRSGPPAGVEAAGSPPTVSRHAIAYLTALDEPAPGARIPTADDPAPTWADGTSPAGGPPPPAAVPRVLLAVAEPEAVAPLWGQGLHGVLVRDPDHLRALLARAGRRATGGGPRWVLLPWDEIAHPGLWARGWARVVEWAPGAMQPAIVPRAALAAACGDETTPAPAGRGRPGPGGPAAGAGLRTTSPPAAPAAGDGSPAAPGRSAAGPGWLRGATRARSELLRQLEEFVPAPVVIPVADAPPSATARATAGLAGVPVWWLWPPRGVDGG